MPEPDRIDKRSLRYAGRREELLDALTRYVIDNGVGELTVRQLAKAVGVSHASLLNHFDSKENLLSEVIENMRGESIPIAVPMKPGVDPATVLTAWWTERTTPEVLPRFRVMVEIYALALGDRDRYGRFLDRFVGDWIEHWKPVYDKRVAPPRTMLPLSLLCCSRKCGVCRWIFWPPGTGPASIARSGFLSTALPPALGSGPRQDPIAFNADRSPRSTRSRCRLLPE